MTKSIRAAALAETNRVNKIKEVAAGHPAIEAKAIAEGWDPSKTELHVLRAARPQATPGGAFGINTGRGSRLPPTSSRRPARVSGGIPEKVAFAGMTDKAKEIAASKPMRRQTIYGLCAIVAAANGVHMPSSRMDNDVIQAMFTIERRPADPGRRRRVRWLLDHVASAASPRTSSIRRCWPPTATSRASCPTSRGKPTRTISSTFKRYRMTASGDYAEIGPNGELKSMGLQDESYPNQVTTKGVIVNVGRELMVNDDMGALTQLPDTIGRKAALKREKVVFQVLGTAPTTAAPGASVNQTANGFNFFCTRQRQLLERRRFGAVHFVSRQRHGSCSSSRRTPTATPSWSCPTAC